MPYDPLISEFSQAAGPCPGVKKLYPLGGWPTLRRPTIVLTPRHDREDTTAAPRPIAAIETVLRVPCPRCLGAGLFGPRPPIMPKGLKRYYGQRHLHFITCSCYRRLPLLRSAKAKNILVRILGEVRDRYGFALTGYVVMPEHIHLLISEPAHGTPSTVMQVLKQRVSRRLRRKTRTSARQLTLRFAQDPLPRFWQLRFHDFNVWSHKKRVVTICT